MIDGINADSTVAVHRFFDFNDAIQVSLRPSLDKDELRARLLDQLETVLTYLFPRGRRQGSRFLVGNLQGDPGDSLVIELEGDKRGVWIDFATGESGDILRYGQQFGGFDFLRNSLNFWKISASGWSCLDLIDTMRRVWQGPVPAAMILERTVQSGIT